MEHLPPLPDYHLRPASSLIPLMSDKLLALILPTAVYWILSLLFHWIDEKNYFARYRLHTPAEVLKRNRVSRWEVVRDVAIQQVIQTGVGHLLNMTEPDEYVGREAYDVAVWAQRIRIAQRAVPGLLALIGLNADGLSKSVENSYPAIARVLSGGIYRTSDRLAALSNGQELLFQTFTTWEMSLAKALYWVIIPAMQFCLASFVLDTWQYFLHRAMHMNKWLYTKFHSRHHRLYVPYAFGALYNHPFEGFLLDTVGAAIAFKLAGLSVRQGMCFFTGSTIKTIDDHCGYALPWDPLQMLTSNNASYHDIHHQSWGIKTNFSQPFFTVWDRLLGTKWTGGDVSARYERARSAAQVKIDEGDVASIQSLATGGTGNEPPANESEPRGADPLGAVPAKQHQRSAPKGKAEEQAAASRQQVLEDWQYGGSRVFAEEAEEEKEARTMLRRSARRRTASSLTQSDSLRGLREKVNIHGRTGGILGMDSGR